jgi:hypothetical protein
MDANGSLDLIPEIAMIRTPRGPSRPLTEPAFHLASRDFREEGAMPMDRLDRVLNVRRLTLTAGVMLSLATGCRSTKSEVPPGKPYQTTGGMPPTVGFSSDPHPGAARGLGGLYANKGPGGLIPDGRGSQGTGNDLVLGTPTPGENRYGAPSDHMYGAPGSSGLAGGSASGTPSLGDSLLKTIPSGSRIVAEDPETSPASGTRPAGSNAP